MPEMCVTFVQAVKNSWGMRIEEPSMWDGFCCVVCGFPRKHLEIETVKYKGGVSCVSGRTNESYVFVMASSGVYVGWGVFSGSSSMAGLTFLTVPLLPLR